jgi:hypothetical protein
MFFINATAARAVARATAAIYIINELMKEKTRNKDN